MRRSLKNVRLRFAREQGFLVLLLVAYVVTGRLGLELAYTHPATSVVWPPAGIALGAFLIYGYRIWVAILAGGVITYSLVVGATPAVVAMAAGNTLEGLLAAYLINRFAGGRSALQNPLNSFRFAGLVTLSGLTVGATVGTAAMILGGLAPLSDYGAIWMNWSLGNVAGSLVVGPTVILGVQARSARWRPSGLVEGIAVFTSILLVCLVVFWDIPGELHGFPLEFLCVPVLLWSAFRLGRRPTAAALLLMASLAISGTLNGHGPFIWNDPTKSLIIVQSFMSVTAVMTLSLSALASEYVIATAQLRELVVTDPLTGLPNYRRLVEVLGAEIARSNRTDEPCAVVFFDMDGLKRINDELGHLIGSRAVCRFAETLRASCRATDTAARYGGDEFVCVLPDTDEEGASVVIRRVVERLAEDPDKPQLSTSAGVAVYPKDGGTPTTLLSAADRALYAVKAQKANSRKRGVVPIREWTNVG
jgi:diguanylate cyclase (GGDEF)-like protein